jgi:hypothetical protein
MGILLPILAFAAFAALSSPKTSNKALAPVEPNPNTLPSNVSLIPAGDFEWGVTIVLGQDITAEQTDEALDIIVARALEYPGLVFEVELDEEAIGIPLFFYEGGVAYEQWAENVSYLGAYLDDALSQFTEQG